MGNRVKNSVPFNENYTCQFHLLAETGLPKYIPQYPVLNRDIAVGILVRLQARQNFTSRHYFHIETKRIKDVLFLDVP